MFISLSKRGVRRHHLLRTSGGEQLLSSYAFQPTSTPSSPQSCLYSFKFIFIQFYFGSNPHIVSEAAHTLKHLPHLCTPFQAQELLFLIQTAAIHSPSNYRSLLCYAQDSICTRCSGHDPSPYVIGQDTREFGSIRSRNGTRWRADAWCKVRWCWKGLVRRCKTGLYWRHHWYELRIVKSPLPSEGVRYVLVGIFGAERRRYR